MAFFKFRKSVDEAASVPVQAQNIDAIRQRAKYRLTGAAVLVLIGVVGLPLLFDKQPRPIAVDTPIDIPDKNKVLPLAIPATPARALPQDKATVVASAPTIDVLQAQAAAVDTEKEVQKQAKAQVDKAQEARKIIAKESAATDQAAASSAVSAPADSRRAQALLDGKEASAKKDKAVIPESAAPKASAADAGRFVVQVGAFSDNARAHEVRLKVEAVGLKTYTQVADTKDGKRIRVRVGPFATRAEAEKAAEKIKKVKLPAALLAL